MIRHTVAILLVALTLAVPAAAQKKSKTSLVSVDNILGIAAISDRTNWALSIQHQHPDYPARTNKQVIAQLDTLKPFFGGGEDLYTKNRAALVDVLDRIGLIGNDLARYLGKDSPFAFGEYKGKTCLVLHNLSTDNVYNTLRTTAKERAAKIIESGLLPMLDDVHSAMKTTSVDYYAIILSYGSKDFSDESEIGNLEAECVCLIVSKSDCEAFTTTKITDNQLLAKSAVLLCDRDTRTSFKKIAITIN